MKTQGRYVVVVARDWPVRRFDAALGFTESLPEACEEAHVYASSASPVEVYDTETRCDKTRDLVRVHTTAR